MAPRQPIHSPRITVPDDLLKQAKAAGLNLSRVSAAALCEQLDRRAKIAALDRYLRELDVELGPVSSEDEAAAQEWADRALGNPGQREAGRTSQGA